MSGSGFLAAALVSNGGFGFVQCTSLLRVRCLRRLQWCGD